VINITIQFETLAEASAALERMNGSTAAKAEAVAVIEKAAKAPKPAPAPAPTPTASETVTAPAPAAVEPEPAAASPSEITYDQVATSVLAYIKTHGKPAAIEIFGTFGLKSLTAATPDQFPAIKAAFEGVSA